MRQVYKRSGIGDTAELQETALSTEQFGFSKMILDRSQRMTLNSGDYEVGLIVFSGTCNVTCEGFEALNIGERNNVYSGNPVAVYIPIHTEYTVMAVGYGKLEIGVCCVRASQKYEPFVVKPEQVKNKICGQFNWKREVNEIIGDEYAGRVEKLILGETLGYPGQWASYPYGQESEKQKLTTGEAVYHFKILPTPNEGLQVMHSDDPKLEAEYKLRSEKTLLIENAYRPAVNSKDYDVYYLWIKARA